MAKLSLNSSENIRDGISRQQQISIRAAYRRAAAETAKAARNLNDENSSTPLERARLDELARQLKDAQDEISRQLERDIPRNMQTAAQAMINDNRQWLQGEGMSIRGAYSNVPRDVVQAVISGKIYQPMANGQQWNYSQAIWGDNRRIHNEIDRIIAQGIAANKSTYEIAKDLELYVNPSAAKPWDWGKVYPGTRRQIDYNAQRLARTLVSHAFQLAFVSATRANPFVSGYIWHSAGIHGRTCDICEDLDGQFFEKDELPLDHPNGLCYWEAVIPDLVDVADRIADWYSGKDDPELDAFADSLYGSSWNRVNDYAETVRRDGSVND